MRKIFCLLSVLAALVFSAGEVDAQFAYGNSYAGDQGSDESSATGLRMLSLSPSYLEGWTSASASNNFTNLDIMDALHSSDGNRVSEVNQYHFKVSDELSFIPVPIIAAGFIAKTGKNNFREARFRLNSNFHDRTDDYIQHLPIVTTFALKIAGYEGKNNWGRFLVSGVLSYATMGLLVNSVKYTAKEMRPDGSTANSFPSGHTATAFVAATILHKEYGLTRSPWFSVLGYSAAATTGVMRSLNNRHWISDIMVGAGFGILATDLGYVFGGLIFKDKGVKRLEREGNSDLYQHPSFISLGMGATRLNNIDIPSELYSSIGYAPTFDGKLRIGNGTTVQFEGAYYFNPYFGLGGKGRVSIYPVRANGLNDFTYSQEQGKVVPCELTDADVTDQMAAYQFDLGPYFSLPFSKRWRASANLSLGYMHMADYDLFFSDDRDLKASDVRHWTEEQWNEFFAKGHTIGDYISVDDSKSMKFGAGLALTWAYRENISFDLKLTYDYSRSPFKAMYYDDYAFVTDYEMLGKDYEVAALDALHFADTKKSFYQLGVMFNMSFNF